MGSPKNDCKIIVFQRGCSIIFWGNKRSPVQVRPVAPKKRSTFLSTFFLLCGTILVIKEDFKGCEQEGSCVMIERLVKEIRIGLENRCYISALTTALTLPDICGRAKYPDKKTTQRYKDWLNDYVCINRPFAIQADAETIYSLRCCLLHEGNPSIDKAKCKIEQFGLIVRKNSAHIPLEGNCIETKQDGSRVCHYYNISLNHLCEKLCEAALEYYTSHEEQFNFFDYRIINTDDATAQSNGLPEEVIEVKL